VKEGGRATSCHLQLNCELKEAFADFFLNWDFADFLISLDVYQKERISEAAMDGGGRAAPGFA
jgi:hypothetical protein